MRLLEVKTLSLKEFTGNNIPPYAILSHTWQEGKEVTLKELGSSKAKSKSGYKKIRHTCEQADKDGLAYAWVDTCCINKESSVELSEAINSMFQWYKDAKVCYAYLEDIDANGSNLKDARWFTRGWTLQELLAPTSIILYSKEWKCVGTKSNCALLLSQITGIDKDVLLDVNRLHHASIARRMSWASQRITTRKEDEAYCLLGIFEVKMPLLYGEGDQAFIRLQEEIIKDSIDQSIFAWSSTSDAINGCFASCPRDFAEYANIGPLSSNFQPYSMTNIGLSIRLPVLAVPFNPSLYLVILNCGGTLPRGFNRRSTSHSSYGYVVVQLRSTGGDHSLFVRPPQRCYLVPEKCLRLARTRSIYIAKDRLVLNRATGYLKISMASSSSERIRLQTSFEYDGFEHLRSDDSEFHENTRTIKIIRTAGQSRGWRYALLCGCDSTRYYVITVDLSDKAQSASVGLQSLPGKDKSTCEDQIRNLLRSSSRLNEAQIVAYAATSSSTTLYASIRWTQDQLVLTIEHLSALIPYIPARILPKTRFFRAMIHAVIVSLGILFLWAVCRLVGLRGVVMVKIALSAIPSVLIISCIRQSPEFPNIERPFRKVVGAWLWRDIYIRYMALWLILPLFTYLLLLVFASFGPEYPKIYSILQLCLSGMLMNVLYYYFLRWAADNLEVMPPQFELL